MRSSMSFQIKGIIEAFPTESTQVPLDLRVGLQMALEKFRELEILSTNFAYTFGIPNLSSCNDRHILSLSQTSPCLFYMSAVQVF